MKKLLLLCITGSVLLSCNNADKKETELAKNSDWTGQNLKGSVQTMEETTYTPDSSGKIGAMDSCCINVQQFDEKGYNTGSKSKDSKGTVKEESTFTHYEGGQAKHIISTKAGKPSGSFEITINKEGKYSGATAMDSVGKISSYYTNLAENEYGAVTSGTEHKPDSSVKASFTNEYNKASLVSSSGKDSSGKVTYMYKAELDDKGNVAKQTETNITKDSTTTKVTSFKYDSFDEQGNWTQRTKYDDKGKATQVTKRSYTYYKKE